MIDTEVLVGSCLLHPVAAESLMQLSPAPSSGRQLLDTSLRYWLGESMSMPPVARSKHSASRLRSLFNWLGYFFGGLIRQNSCSWVKADSKGDLFDNEKYLLAVTAVTQFIYLQFKQPAAPVSDPHEHIFSNIADTSSPVLHPRAQ
jgi:hypothetical protein